MEFISLNHWLMLVEAKKEAKKETKRSNYGCVMLYATVTNWDKHISKIDKEDIYDDDKKDYGLEHTPHVTVLFGIHLDETKPEDVEKLMKLFKPVDASVNTIGIFENENYDVVKYDVPVTEQLKEYHEAVMAAFPNTQTFPDYHPHMTISYVKPGEGKKYKGKVKPFKVTFDLAVYSMKSSDAESKKIKVGLQEEKCYIQVEYGLTIKSYHFGYILMKRISKKLLKTYQNISTIKLLI